MGQNKSGPSTSSKISTADIQKAEQLSVLHTRPEKVRQVYLNTLAILAVSSYCKSIEIETEWEESDSWDFRMRDLMNVSDLKIKDIGQLECLPVFPENDTLHISPEVQSNRIAYVIVEIDETSQEKKLLGFVENVTQEMLPLTELRSLDKLPNRISEIDINNKHNQLVRSGPDTIGYNPRKYNQDWKKFSHTLYSPNGVNKSISRGELSISESQQISEEVRQETELALVKKSRRRNGVNHQEENIKRYTEKLKRFRTIDAYNEHKNIHYIKDKNQRIKHQVISGDQPISKSQFSEGEKSPSTIIDNFIPEQADPSELEKLRELLLEDPGEFTRNMCMRNRCDVTFQVVCLMRLDGYTFKEIATVFVVSMGSISAFYSRKKRAFIEWAKQYLAILFLLAIISYLYLDTY